MAHLLLSRGLAAESLSEGAEEPLLSRESVKRIIAFLRGPRRVHGDFREGARGHRKAAWEDGRESSACLPLWVDQHEQPPARFAAECADCPHLLSRRLHEARHVVLGVRRLGEPRTLAIDTRGVQPLLGECRRHARLIRRDAFDQIAHERRAGFVQLHDASLPAFISRTEVSGVSAG